MAFSFGDGSVGKVIALDLSSIPRTYLKVWGVMVCPCNLSIRVAETGKSLGLSSLTDELPAKTLFQRKQMAFLWTTPEVVF